MMKKLLLLSGMLLGTALTASAQEEVGVTTAPATETPVAATAVVSKDQEKLMLQIKSYQAELLQLQEKLPSLQANAAEKKKQADASADDNRDAAKKLSKDATDSKSARNASKAADKAAKDTKVAEKAIKELEKTEKQIEQLGRKIEKQQKKLDKLQLTQQ